MKVIICGAGQVGWQIAKHLSDEKNDVTVIDNNPEQIRRLTNTLDVAVITGSASYPNILEQAGARDCDMIIATTYSDEVNMIACQVAHSLFSIPRKIARIRSQAYLEVDYSDLYRSEHLPIDVIISPEKEVAEAALRRLEAPSAFEISTFMDGRAQLIGITLDKECAVLNTPIQELSELFLTLEAIILGVRRDGVLFVPGPTENLFANDQIYVFSSTKDRSKMLEIFGKANVVGDKVLIVGAGNVGLGVALSLEQNKTNRMHCKLIEKNRVRAEVAADSLERSIILNGDGLDLTLLEEASINKVDAFLAVTDDDKTNLLSCTRAKAAGCPLTISLVNDPSLNSLLKPTGVDAFINPRATTVSSILRHIRHGRVRSVYSIGEAEAELIEAQVLSTSSLSGKMIKEIDWPDGAIVGAIMQGDKIVIPGKETIFTDGDIITVFYLAKDFHQIERLLEVGMDYF